MEDGEHMSPPNELVIKWSEQKDTTRTRKIVMKPLVNGKLDKTTWCTHTVLYIRVETESVTKEFDCCFCWHTLLTGLDVRIQFTWKIVFSLLVVWTRSRYLIQVNWAGIYYLTRDYNTLRSKTDPFDKCHMSYVFHQSHVLCFPSFPETDRFDTWFGIIPNDHCDTV